MLDISNTLKAQSFFGADCVCFSRKPKKTHCGSHQKAWYSLWAMMSFMAVWVLILLMSRLDHWGSAEGSDKQDTVERCLRLKCRCLIWKCVSLPAPFVEVWRVWYCFALADWHIYFSWHWWIDYIPQSTSVHNIYCASFRCYFSWSCLRLL